MSAERAPDAAGVVAVIPAAGSARRLGPLETSKEILPVFFDEPGGVDRVAAAARPVVESLLASLAAAEVRLAYVIVRSDKWDIVERLGDGARYGLDLAYLITAPTPGVPWTVDRAHAFVGDRVVALGFPDIVVEPRDAFVHLRARIEAAPATDVVLALMPGDRPDKIDMVEHDRDGRVRRIVPKPGETGLEATWMLALWTPVFTAFLHEHVAGVPAPMKGELHLGDVIQAFLDAGGRVDGVWFPQGRFLDVGTPDDLRRATER